jgi:hypothetical protein
MLMLPLLLAVVLTWQSTYPVWLQPAVQVNHSLGTVAASANQASQALA